jgi:hypothetical protein
MADTAGAENAPWTRDTFSHESTSLTVIRVQVDDAWESVSLRWRL